jgi:hypothetical protein|nr:MAG TPA: hypothetical protein [Caudoviricetes sp.]
MLVNFKLGTSEDYRSNTGSYSNYIYACTDTKDVYFYGVLQQGISDELWQKLSNPENLINSVINSLKNKANGIAGLNENGKLDSSLVEGMQAEVMGIDAVATSSTLPSDSVADGWKVYTTDNKKINEYSTDTSNWTTIDPSANVIYNFRNSDAAGDTGRTNILYRWDGAEMTEISESITIGEVTGTAYDGAKGKENRDALNSLPEKLLYLTNNQGTVSEHNLQFSFDTYTKNSGNNQYTKDGTALTLNVPVFDEGSAAQQGLITKADYDYLKSLGIVILSGTELQEIYNSNGETPLSEDLYNKLNADGVKLVISADNTVAKNTSIFTVVNSDGSILLSQGGLSGDDDENILLSTGEFDINSDKIASKKGVNATIQKSGDGSKALFDDGTYKPISIPDNVVTQVKVGDNDPALTPTGGLISLPLATNEADGIFSKADKASLESLKGLGILVLTPEETSKMVLEEGTLDESLYNKIANENVKLVVFTSVEKGDAGLGGGEPQEVERVYALFEKIVHSEVNSIELTNSRISIDSTGTYLTHVQFTISSDKSFTGSSNSVTFQKNGDGTKYLSDDGTYQAIEVPTKATQIQLSEAYAPSELENEALEPAAGDTLEVATGKLHKSILDNEEVVSSAINNLKNGVGLTDTFKVPESFQTSNYMNSVDNLCDALLALDAKLKEIEDALTLKTVE